MVRLAGWRPRADAADGAPGGRSGLDRGRRCRLYRLWPAADQHAGVSPANITTTLNTWMSQMCTTIKQNGIIIYTILFNNSNSTTATLFQNCASPGPPTHYFNSPTGTDLQNAFTQIGQELSSLRLSQ